MKRPSRQVLCEEIGCLFRLPANGLISKKAVSLQERENKGFKAEVVLGNWSRVGVAALEILEQRECDLHPNSELVVQVLSIFLEPGSWDMISLFFEVS